MKRLQRRRGGSGKGRKEMRRGDNISILLWGSGEAECWRRRSRRRCRRGVWWLM